MYIGIDVGGTNLKAGLVDQSGTILAVERTPLDFRGPESFADTLASLAKAVMASGGAAAQDVRVGGAVCRVVTRSYTLADGSTARALSATPAAYLERLTGSGVQMQLITGYVLADMDALCVVEGATSILAARDGDFIYMIETEAGDSALYALGAAAVLEQQP